MAMLGVSLPLSFLIFVFLVEEEDLFDFSYPATFFTSNSKSDDDITQWDGARSPNMKIDIDRPASSNQGVTDSECLGTAYAPMQSPQKQGCPHDLNSTNSNNYNPASCAFTVLGLQQANIGRRYNMVGSWVPIARIPPSTIRHVARSMLETCKRRTAVTVGTWRTCGNQLWHFLTLSDGMFLGPESSIYSMYLDFVVLNSFRQTCRRRSSSHLQLR
jgi:hypothetical protein